MIIDLEETNQKIKNDWNDETKQKSIDHSGRNNWHTIMENIQGQNRLRLVSQMETREDTTLQSIQWWNVCLSSNPIISRFVCNWSVISTFMCFITWKGFFHYRVKRLFSVCGEGSSKKSRWCSSILLQISVEIVLINHQVHIAWHRDQTILFILIDQKKSFASLANQ